MNTYRAYPEEIRSEILRYLRNPGFLLPTLTQFASILLMVAVLLWRPQGVYPVANR